LAYLVAWLVMEVVVKADPVDHGSVALGAVLEMLVEGLEELLVQKEVVLVCLEVVLVKDLALRVAVLVEVLVMMVAVLEGVVEEENLVKMVAVLVEVALWEGDLPLVVDH